MHNFSYWITHFNEMIFSPYNAALGLFVWPLIFTGVIGYVYVKQESYVAAAVSALILMAVFSNAMTGMEIWVSLIYILVALAITGLFLIFLSKRRN
jgi:hypothetical protein